MATGQEVLAFLKLTVEEANAFILANIEQPQLILDTTKEFGITTQHLSDITGYSTDIISDYFFSSGFDSRVLEDTKILFNSELGDLASLVGFNERSDALSAASLANLVKPNVDPLDYDFFFEPVFNYQQADSIYTPDELGVPHLGNNVPATNEKIESLVYGTLINLYSALDDTELNELKGFAHNGSNVDEYRALLTDALNDPANRSDQELAELIKNETITLINEFWYGEVEVTGSLDLSLLGVGGIA